MARVAECRRVGRAVVSDTASDDYALADAYLTARGVGPVAPAPHFDPDAYAWACTTFYLGPAQLTERDVAAVARVDVRLARKVQAVMLGWRETPVADAAGLAAPLPSGDFATFFERYVLSVARGTRFQFAKLEQKCRDLQNECLELKAQLAATSPVLASVNDDPDL